MGDVDTELHDERLHGCGIVDVGNLKPERLALLDGGVDFGGVPGMVLVEGVDGAEEVDGGVRSLDDPDGGFGLRSGCTGSERAKKDEEGVSLRRRFIADPFGMGTGLQKWREGANTGGTRRGSFPPFAPGERMLVHTRFLPF